jgi:hypothetical protein
MSAWFDALGALSIALGAHQTWRDSRILLSGPHRRGERCRAERTTRRKATAGLGYGLFYIVIGVLWVTGWHPNPVVAWLPVGFVIVVLTYDVGAWSRSRRRRQSGRIFTRS